MKVLIRVRVQYASRQQCCKTHKRPLPLPLKKIPVASVTGIFLVDTDRTMCPGVNSTSKKLVPRIPLGGKGGRCVRLTTYQPCSAERQEIRGLNLPETPWVISTACCGRDLYLYLYISLFILLCFISNYCKFRTRCNF